MLYGELLLIIRRLQILKSTLKDFEICNLLIISDSFWEEDVRSDIGLKMLS